MIWLFVLLDAATAIRYYTEDQHRPLAASYYTLSASLSQPLCYDDATIAIYAYALATQAFLWHAALQRLEALDHLEKLLSGAKEGE